MPPRPGSSGSGGILPYQPKGGKAGASGSRRLPRQNTPDRPARQAARRGSPLPSRRSGSANLTHGYVAGESIDISAPGPEALNLCGDDIASGLANIVEHAEILSARPAFRGDSSRAATFKGSHECPAQHRALPAPPSFAPSRAERPRRSNGTSETPPQIAIGSYHYRT